MQGTFYLFKWSLQVKGRVIISYIPVNKNAIGINLNYISRNESLTIKGVFWGVGLKVCLELTDLQCHFLDCQYTVKFISYKNIRNKSFL